MFFPALWWQALWEGQLAEPWPPGVLLFSLYGFFPIPCWPPGFQVTGESWPQSDQLCPQSTKEMVLLPLYSPVKLSNVRKLLCAQPCGGKWPLPLSTHQSVTKNRNWWIGHHHKPTSHLRGANCLLPLWTGFSHLQQIISTHITAALLLQHGVGAGTSKFTSCLLLALWCLGGTNQSEPELP